MSYITLAEAKQYLGVNIYESAYDDFTNPGTQDDNILTADIDDITAEIDMAIMQVYDKTITATKALNYLRALSGKMLLGRAYERFNFSEVPESVLATQRTARAQLIDIKEGRMRFDDETQESRDSKVKYYFQSANTDGTGRQVFNRDTMSGY